MDKDGGQFWCQSGALPPFGTDEILISGYVPFPPPPPITILLCNFCKIGFFETDERDVSLCCNVK